MRISVILTAAFLTTTSIACASDADVSTKKYYLQLGAYKRQESAETTKARIAKLGIEAKETLNIYGLKCLYLGGFNSFSEASKEGKRLLHQKKIKQFIVVPAKELKVGDSPTPKETTGAKSSEGAVEITNKTEGGAKTSVDSKAILKADNVSATHNGMANSTSTDKPEEICSLSEQQNLKDKLSAAVAKIEQLNNEKAEIAKNLGLSLSEIKRLKTDIEKLQKALLANGYDRLLELAESGDIVFLERVGEVRIGAGFGKVVVRVPKLAVDRADRLFSPIMAERIAGNGCVYYITDSKFLNKQ